MSVQLHYQKLGNSNGDTIIFLHGLFGSGRNLYTLAKQFAVNHQIFILDIRNHGCSPHHKEMDYLVMNDDLNCFIEQMKITSPILIGHSMGGKIAMVNALMEPELSKAIVILDIAPIAYTIDYIPLIDTLLSLDLEQLKSRSEADCELAKTYDNAVFRQFLLQNLIRIDGKFQWRLDLNTIRNKIEMIKSFPSMTGKQYDKPVFFLTGADSDYILPEHQDTILKLFPVAKLASIADAGHWLQADQPQRVTDRIQEFLNSHP